ncbi:MAG: hypothetical protein PHP85_07275 [Gallionella sp.]|nr:hypothetical protein [Gallionella sp.]
MKHAKLFSILVFAITLVYGAIGFCFLPLAGFQSELTRMAMLPETMFGWTKPQPAIDPALMRQSSWQEADILVVGDSFSDGRVWQTVLTQKGLRVRTESWDSVRGICADFMPWLREQGFRGKYIVFESVERNLVDGIAKSADCQQMQFHHSIHADSPRSPPASSFDPNQVTYSGRFSIGIQTRLNIFKYEKITHAAGFTSHEFPNGARLARVANGCNLFSHARCDDALFLSADRPDDLPTSTLDNIGKLNTRMHGITPVWVFVPNKSTVYLYPEKQFWNKAEQRFLAPNILKTFRQAIDAGTVDLYPANNTHVSTTGYLILGNAIYQSMQAINGG